MPGYLSFVLHAHLPFVRHPEHAKFLEESWLFEAITETYLPLLQLLEQWQQDDLDPHLTLSLSPTLCAMLRDPLLQGRYARHLEERLELAEKEVHRTQWDKPFLELARFYLERFRALREVYARWEGNLVKAFRHLQELRRLEVITTAATHALLPLLQHPPSIRAQLLVARDCYRGCFGRDPIGLWLPECAYTPAVEEVMQEANLRWFIADTHGLSHATPQPRYGVFAPIFTDAGIAVFGRDRESARQVWSRHEGYPGDPRYREFYRDAGFDLDFDYIKPYLPGPEHRGFTGLKYHRITGGTADKQVYDRAAALQAAQEHACHFLEARRAQIRRLAAVFDRPPLVLSPYDAELFGHWWFEGPDFLDALVRQAALDPATFTWITPSEYLRRHPTNQAATPAPSSWGEEGYWRFWVNEKNQWIYPHLHIAQQRMTELAKRFPRADALFERALKQAARELLLAQASDWPFILRTGTSPDYARKRIKDHLLRFTRCYEQLNAGSVDQNWLSTIEAADNLFPEVDYRDWT